MNRKSIWQFVKDVFTQWIEDEPFLLASSLSYYTLFSLTPLLVIAIAVAGLVFGREAAQNQIVETIGGMIGTESAQAIRA
jgi:membrane protein